MKARLPMIVRSSWFTGLSPIYRHRLQPKERLTLTKKTLVFDANAERAAFGENRAAAGAGEYQAGRILVLEYI